MLFLFRKWWHISLEPPRQDDHAYTIVNGGKRSCNGQQGPFGSAGSSFFGATVPEMRALALSYREGAPRVGGRGTGGFSRQGRRFFWKTGFTLDY